MIRQEWPATLTREEIATHVRDHMLQQGERAAGRFTCFYHMPDGKACAAGCLLSDEEAKHVPEGQAFNARSVSKGMVVPDRLRPHIRLIRALQIAHDESPSVDFVITQCNRVIAGETLESEQYGSSFILGGNFKP